jgi:hypothetical protein
VRPGTELELPKNLAYKAEKRIYLGDVAGAKLDDPSRAGDILDSNLGKLVYVPAGKTLLLPEEAPYEVIEDATLGQVAQKALGDSDKAQKLLDLNRDDLESVIDLSEGAELRLPQKNWPAVLAFGLLVLFLILVGTGLLFRPALADSNGPEDRLAREDGVLSEDVPN